MEIRKTTGVILSARKSGEADLICTVLTRDFGKAKFIFKGLRKSKKRPHSAAEPGSVTLLQYYHHDEREVSVVSDFSTLRHHGLIRRDLKKIYHLYILLETTDSTTGAGDAGTGFFAYLDAALDRLAATPYPSHLTAAYLIHLLRFNGLFEFSPRCSACGSTGFKRFALNPSDLKILCEDCSPGIRLLPGRVIEFIERSLSKKFIDINAELFPEAAVLDLTYELLLFIESYYHVVIKSKEFILR